MTAYRTPGENTQITAEFYKSVYCNRIKRDIHNCIFLTNFMCLLFQHIRFVGHHRDNNVFTPFSLQFISSWKLQEAWSSPRPNTAPSTSPKWRRTSMQTPNQPQSVWRNTKTRSSPYCRTWLHKGKLQDWMKRWADKRWFTKCFEKQIYRLQKCTKVSSSYEEN